MGHWCLPQGSSSALESVSMIIEKNGCGWDVSSTVFWKIMWCDVNNNFTRDGGSKLILQQQQQSSLKNQGTPLHQSIKDSSISPRVSSTVITLCGRQNIWRFLGGESSVWRNLTCVCSLQTLLHLIVKDSSWMIPTILKRTNNDDAALVNSLGWFKPIMITQGVGREISKEGGREECGVDYEEGGVLGWSSEDDRLR